MFDLFTFKCDILCTSLSLFTFHPQQQSGSYFADEESFRKHKRDHKEKTDTLRPPSEASAITTSTERRYSAVSFCNICLAIVAAPFCNLFIVGDNTIVVTMHCIIAKNNLSYTETC